MTKDQSRKPYDLEDRTLEFARRTRSFVKRLPRTISNAEDVRQLARASGSVGANYREANEAVSKKDFALRIKIARKESKERAYWLQLVDAADNVELEDERSRLVQEATELVKIFNSIVQKTQ